MKRGAIIGVILVLACAACGPRRVLPPRLEEPGSSLHGPYRHGLYHDPFYDPYFYGYRDPFYGPGPRYYVVERRPENDAGGSRPELARQPLHRLEERRERLREQRETLGERLGIGRRSGGLLGGVTRGGLGGGLLRR